MTMGGMSKAKARRNTRHKPKYLAYRNNDTREKNKAYKIIMYLERRPDDKVAQASLEALPEFCVRSARIRRGKDAEQG